MVCFSQEAAWVGKTPLITVRLSFICFTGTGNMQATAPAASHISALTFDGVVNAVPQLRDACCSDLSGYYPGLGVKLLRLVCKQLRVSSLDLVQGYTLALDGKNVSLMSEMILLKGTRLSRLKVVLNTGVDGRSIYDFSKGRCLL